MEQSTFRPSGLRALRSQIWLRKTTQEVASIYLVVEPIDATSWVVLWSHAWLRKAHEPRERIVDCCTTAWSASFKDYWNVCACGLPYERSRSVSDIHRSYNLLFRAKAINGLAKWRKKLYRFICLSNLPDSVTSWVILRTLSLVSQRFWSWTVGQIFGSASIACSPFIVHSLAGNQSISATVVQATIFHTMFIGLWSQEWLCKTKDVTASIYQSSKYWTLFSVDVLFPKATCGYVKLLNPLV